MDQLGEDIKNVFQPISASEIKQEQKVHQMEITIKVDDHQKGKVPLSKFGPHPNTKKP